MCQAAPFVEQSFAAQPLIEARLRLTLGISFWYLGEAELARQQYQRSLDLRKVILGPDHPDTHTSMINLATSYQSLGRDAEALELQQETLALRKATLGPDHPDTLRLMNNLANSYSALGRDAEALKVREETLALRKDTLGPEHPDTLRSMNNLANSYHASAGTPRRHAPPEDSGISEGHARPRPPRHAREHDGSGKQLRCSRPARRGAPAPRRDVGASEVQDRPRSSRHLRSMMGLGNSYAALGRHAEGSASRGNSWRLRRPSLAPTTPTRSGA